MKGINNLPLMYRAKTEQLLLKFKCKKNSFASYFLCMY